MKTEKEGVIDENMCEVMERKGEDTHDHEGNTATESGGARRSEDCCFMFASTMIG